MRILYVEDESSGNHKELLIAANFQVQSVGGIREANRLLKTNEYDVVLVDLDWGIEGEGLSGVSELRKSSAPVVVLARTKDLKALKECDGFGITDYLIKDGLSFERLVARLEFVLKKVARGAEVALNLTKSKRKITLNKKTLESIQPFICLGA